MRRTLLLGFVVCLWGCSSGTESPITEDEVRKRIINDLEAMKNDQKSWESRLGEKKLLYTSSALVDYEIISLRKPDRGGSILYEAKVRIRYRQFNHTPENDRHLKDPKDFKTQDVYFYASHNGDVNNPKGIALDFRLDPIEFSK